MKPAAESHQLWKTVLVLGSITGIILVFVTPPFQVPDEGAHFFRAWQTSAFNLRLEQPEGRPGAYLPRSVRDTKQLFDDIPLNPSARMTRDRFERAMSLAAKDPAFASIILPYPPVAYMAQTVGIWIGEIASAPPIISFYLARIMNLALFLFMVTWAMRWIPDMKWGLALLILMPMALYEAASVSADAYTTGISFLMIAFLLRCITAEGQFNTKQISFMFVGTVLLTLAKPGYAPIILLALLIPTCRFGTGRRRLAVIGGMLALAFVIGLAVMFAVRHYELGLPGSSNAEQLRFILTHPFTYLGTCFRCIFRASQYGSFIGWFGWLELRLPLWIILPYGLLLIAVPFERRIFLVLNRNQRLFVGGLFVLLGAIIFTIQYLSYTPVGKRSIDSVQGRYFIPFAPLLLLVFNSSRSFFSIGDHIVARRCLVGFVVFVHVVSIALLIRRYYL